MTTPQAQPGGSQDPSSPTAPTTPAAGSQPSGPAAASPAASPPAAPAPAAPAPATTPVPTIGTGRPTLRGLGTAKLLFVVLFGWLILQLFGLMIWAWATYPSNADVITIAGAASKETAAQAVALRSQWQQSVLGIGTGLAIAPMTALLSAVVGYLLHDVKPDPTPATTAGTGTAASTTTTS